MSKKQCLLGVDVGTTNCKSILFDTKGQIVDKASREFLSIYDRIGPGWVEQDATAWRDAFVETLQELMGRNDVDLLAMAITNQRPTIVPVDKNCEPVRPAIVWQTTATYKQAAAITEHLGYENVYNKTGLTVDPVWTAPMIKYVVEKEPEIHAKTYKYVQIQTYLLHYLGIDDFLTDTADASAMLLFNLVKNDWDDEICAEVGITRDHLARVVPPGTHVGAVSREAAEKTGLPAGTPLIAGSADSQCSGLGAGANSPGIMNVMIGTAQVGLCYAEAPRFDPNQRVLCHAHAMPGAYLLGSTILAAGDAYRWMRNTVYGKDADYNKMNEEMLKSPLGAGGLLFLPHQASAATPYWDNRATGVFVGLTLGTGRGEIARSIIEGVGFEIAKSFTVIEDMGVPIEAIRMTGGTAFPGSPWNQIHADIYGRAIDLVEVPDTGNLGAAILAAAGVGVYPDVPAASKAMIRITDHIEPNKENHQRYQELAPIHDHIYKSLKQGQVYADLSAFHENG